MILLPLPFKIGAAEALLVFAASVLLVYGPEYLPDIASKLGGLYGKKTGSS